MKTPAKAPKTMDEYIASFPEEIRQILQKVKAVIREEAPEAGETISYGIPTFTLNGRYLIYFAGYKRHISVYPAPTGIPEFEADTAAYRSGKGTLRFPLDQPVPLELIRRIVRFRVKESEARAGK
jgi:uncharacterized protein YdhG (YjbR/CyaY superfamily)